MRNAVGKSLVVSFFFFFFPLKLFFSFFLSLEFRWMLEKGGRNIGISTVQTSNTNQVNFHSFHMLHIAVSKNSRLGLDKKRPYNIRIYVLSLHQHHVLLYHIIPTYVLKYHLLHHDQIKETKKYNV